MISFLTQNIGTIAVGLIIAGIVAAVVIKIVRDKKRGKCVSCDCGCAGCPKASSCGTEQYN